MTDVSTLHEVPPVAGLPADAEGPVFREPWEAQAFALVVQLHQRKLFAWTEWADALSAEIRAVRERGEEDSGADYYRHWLRALECLLAKKGVTDDNALQARREHLLANWPSGHDHVARREPVAIG
ncbi:MAG: nitrile hydratase accessory protein [Panacagrimonas sp.]